MLASGTAYEAESSKPDAQIAGKPASAASLADRGLCADIAIRGLEVLDKAARSTAILALAVMLMVF